MAVLSKPLIADFAKALDPTRRRLENGFARDTETRDRVTRLLRSAPIRRAADRDEGVRSDVQRVTEALAAETRLRRQQQESLAAAFEELQRDLEIVSRL